MRMAVLEKNRVGAGVVGTLLAKRSSSKTSREAELIGCPDGQRSREAEFTGWSREAE